MAIHHRDNSRCAMSGGIGAPAMPRRRQAASFISSRSCSLSSGPHNTTLVVRKSDNEGGGDAPAPFRYGHDAGEPNGIEGAGRRTIQTRLDIPRLPDMPGDGGRA